MTGRRGLFLAAAFVFFAAPSGYGASSRPVATLIAAQGVAEVNRAPVKPPRALLEGEEISTAAGASCTILLGRDAIVHLGEKSVFRLTQVEIEKRKASLRLEQGKMRALLRTQTQKGRPREIEEFTVRSRSATLGVRGTQFVLESPADMREPERFVGIEGTVVVKLDGQQVSDPTAPGSAREVKLERGQAVGGESGAKVQALAEGQLKQESRACVAPPAAVSTPAQFQAPDVLLAGAVEGGGGSTVFSEEAGALSLASPEGALSSGGLTAPGVISVDPVADSPFSGSNGNGANGGGGDDGAGSSGGNGTVVIEIGSGKQDRKR